MAQPSQRANILTNLSHLTPMLLRFPIAGGVISLLSLRLLWKPAAHRHHTGEAVHSGETEDAAQSDGCILGRWGRRQTERCHIKLGPYGGGRRKCNTLYSLILSALFLISFISNFPKFPEVISLNVGGTYFTTRLSTLRRYEDTMLAAMFSGRHYIPRDAEGRFFIDRDGAYFGCAALCS
ncbi:hypothetical protein GOODEAATRI_004685 [Goodea atripinnis]|uniref:Potassium channel tetramerisation-type BTB domain-containing protein n=1 Tax=Goodea atripinnis TaxID=208336 RepID=A0ABV0N7V3_9TELE